MHEWPLVIFTLLMQTSIGCLFTALIGYRLISTCLTPEQSLITMRTVLICTFILGIIGLMGSIFHLGNPLHAFYTLLNVTNSWMSREVLLTAIYMAMLFISLAIAIVKRRIPFGLLVLTVIIGLSDIYVMSAIYANTMFGFWQGGIAYTAFYSSALLLGGILAGYLLLLTTKGLSSREPAKRILAFSLIICCVGVFLLLISATLMATQPEQAATVMLSPKSLPQNMMALSIVRTALIVLGIAIIARLLWTKNYNQMIMLQFSLSLVCIFSAELIGRYTFFDLIT